MESELVLRQDATNALEYVKALEVKDQDSLNMANKSVVRIGVIKKGIIAYFKDPKTKANAAHKAIVDKEKEALKPLIDADCILKPKIGTYIREQMRIKEEAERKAREEEERKELEQEKALKEAAALEDRGRIKEAQARLREAEKMEEDETKEMPLPQAPVMSGTHSVTYTRWRIIDSNLIPRKYLIYDRTRI
ncbi:unnamed protein product, partial [marine sediment metagenome]